VEEGLKNHYKNIMKNVAEIVEIKNTKLTIEQQKSLNLSKKIDNLSREVKKKHDGVILLGKRLEETISDKQALEVENFGLEQRITTTLHEFEERFNIVGSLGDNISDIGMKLLITERELCDTVCKLHLKEKECRKNERLLKDVNIKLEVMMDKYERDVQAQMDKVGEANDEMKEYESIIDLLKVEKENLNGSKNEIFENFTNMEMDKNNEIQTKVTEIKTLKENITSLNKQVEIFNKAKEQLARNQKIGLIAKGIK
jgi:hypothetical protein